jgi:hypothetical protein
MAYTIWERYHDEDSLKNWCIAEQSCSAMEAFEKFFDGLAMEHKIDLVNRMRMYFKYLGERKGYAEDARLMLGYIESLMHPVERASHPEAWFLRSYCIFGDAITTPPAAWNDCTTLSK